jgi:hypothetical protein
MEVEGKSIKAKATQMHFHSLVNEVEWHSKRRRLFLEVD